MGAAGLHCRIHVTTGVSLRKVLETISRSIECASARGERCRVQAGMTTQQERAYLSVCALLSELCVPQPKKQNEDREYDLCFRLRACMACALN